MVVLLLLQQSPDCPLLLRIAPASDDTGGNRSSFRIGIFKNTEQTVRKRFLCWAKSINRVIDFFFESRIFGTGKNCQDSLYCTRSLACMQHSDGRPNPIKSGFGFNRLHTLLGTLSEFNIWSRATLVQARQGDVTKED